MLPKVAVVILNFNTVDLLKKFIPSVLKTEYDNLEIIVADNGSSDNSIAMLEQDFQQITIIDLAENLGFAGGYNAALKQVDADIVVLLNSDVEVSPNWVRPVVDLMLESDHIAAVQPQILDYKKKNYFEYAGAAGGLIDNLGYPFCYGRIFDELEENKGQYNKVKKIFWASGAALFIRKNWWEEVEGLDADFFAHMEEIDLCWRLQRSGASIYYCPDSHVYHVGGATLSKQNARKTFLNFRNALAILIKNLPWYALLWKFPLRLVLDGLAGLKFLSEKKPDHCMAIIKAHFSVYAHWNLWWRKRKEIKKFKSMSALGGVYKGSIVWQYFVKKQKPEVK